MTKIVGSMTRGQSHEICNQIENACKEKGVNPEEITTELIRENFFKDKTLEFIQQKLVKKPSKKSFVVGKVFQHRAEGLIPQYHGDNFKTWLTTPANSTSVSINAFGKNILKEYVLPKNMNDTAIQKASSSTPMGENQFWAMLYLFIIESKLGKKILKYELQKDKVYIFHVKLTSGKVVAVSVYWIGDEWYFDANEFVYYDLWNEGNVFLYPASA